MRTVYGSFLFLALAACAAKAPAPSLGSVPARMETPAVGVDGDAADDPAIYVPADPAQTRIIGTQKKGGLYVYDINGDIVQELLSGRPNNVDLRTDFPFSDGMGVLVVTSDRSDNAIVLWKMDPETGLIDPAPKARIPSGFDEIYGICIGRVDDRMLALATSKTGEVGVWQIDSETDFVQRHSHDFGSIAEGCVIDDEYGHAFIAQETVGIWRMPLTPAVPEPVLIAEMTADYLVEDIEGLAIWKGDELGGYLVASVQGASQFAVFRRDGSRYLGSFAIDSGTGVDGVSGTDGIEISSAVVTEDFPKGLMVGQDDVNTDPAETQNFKFVSFADVIDAIERAD
ncbi:phytase [Parvularcula sp. LCG005]|uniref:phytase n=1 Tax=Parvularcula sp. LCG005 TaxID=3078805 RepID=UPI002943717B|nr:phytase [Parvularcula sp. LCG005]WOI53085.1 phytase [Parvularcula sp. LCG005]